MLWTRIQAPLIRVDRLERRVVRAGQPLKLSPLLFRLAEHLMERPGKVVTRAELKGVLWPYAKRIDTERRLNTAMRALRAALGDDVNVPRYIATARSHGYRWIGNDRGAPGPRLAIGLAAALGLSLALSPRATVASPDLATTLKAQSAMEQWRREPNAASANFASQLLDKAGGEAPSVLAMRAELELGSKWQWSAAERDYQRAIDEDPHNADARLGLAWLRANQGRRGEALALVRDLLGNEVVSGDRRASLGWLLIRAGRPDLAAATCGNDASATLNDLSCSHEAFAALGRYAEAKAAALKVMERVPASLADLDEVRGKGAREAYRAFLMWRSQNFLPGNAPWFQKAQVLADAGDTPAALQALERSVAKREPMAIKIASTPGFAAMRGDPRFERLVGAVGA